MTLTIENFHHKQCSYFAGCPGWDQNPDVSKFRCAKSRIPQNPDTKSGAKRDIEKNSGV